MKSPLTRKRGLFAVPVLAIIALVTTPYKQPAKALTPTPFLLGMFDAAGLLNAVDPNDPNSGFQTMMDDIKRYGFNAVAFNNADAITSSQLLALGDASNYFQIILGPQPELLSQWWNNSSAITFDTATTIATPFVNLLSQHPSLLAYNLVDDADSYSVEKVNPIMQAFKELDPTRAATVIDGVNFNSNTLSVDRYDSVHYDGSTDSAQPNAQLIYNYPATLYQPACNFYTDGIHSEEDQIRLKSRFIQPGTPEWLLLQAHSTAIPGDTNPTHLRYPLPEEMRLQQWIAIGEGVKGIFWFTYHTMPSTEPVSWQGLRDNATLYSTVQDLTTKLAPLGPTLMNLVKIDDKFQITAQYGQYDAYISTLQSKTDGKYYVVVANKASVNNTCVSQVLSVSSRYFTGQLRNMVSGRVYPLTGQFILNGGDGTIFEFSGTPVSPLSGPIPAANLVANASFETLDINNEPAGWQVAPSVASMVSVDNASAHSGSRSLRIQGPSAPDLYVFQSLNASGTNLKPDTQYVFSFWEKTQDVTGTGVGVRLEEIQPALVYLHTQLYAGTNNWRKTVATFKTPADFQGGRVDAIFSISNAGTAWIDDVTLCEYGDGCSSLPYTPITPIIPLPYENFLPLLQ